MLFTIHKILKFTKEQLSDNKTFNNHSEIANIKSLNNMENALYLLLSLLNKLFLWQTFIDKQ